jgi:hypothetical protein
MAMIRMGFVSNSSSSSFVLPKKYLSQEELESLQESMYNTMHNESIHETDHYIYGRISRENEANGIIKRYVNKDGVDYDEG